MAPSNPKLGVLALCAALLASPAACFAPSLGLAPSKLSLSSSHSIQNGLASFVGRRSPTTSLSLQMNGLVQAPKDGNVMLLAQKAAVAVTQKAAFAAAAATLFATAQGLPALYVASLAVSSIGFFKPVWFFSLGYGLSMCAMACLCLWHFSAGAVVPAQVALLHSCFIIAWGWRLSGLVLWKDIFAKTWRKKSQPKKSSPFFKKVLTWAFVALFDTLLFSPALFHLQTPTRFEGMAKLGVALQFVGLTLEAGADQQKQAHKRVSPDTPCTSGFFQLSRHANYLGEVIFWSGTYIAGVGSLTNVLQWSTASLGLVAILMVMVGASKSLDGRQAIKYKDLDGYKEYVRTTSLLFPFTGGDDLDSLIQTAEAKKGGGESEAEAREARAEQGKYVSPYEKNKQPWDV